jgi:hypothetical protein
MTMIWRWSCLRTLRRPAPRYGRVRFLDATWQMRVCFSAIDRERQRLLATGL